MIFTDGGIAQLGEHLLDMQGVTGSSPVVSIFLIFNTLYKHNQAGLVIYTFIPAFLFRQVIPIRFSKVGLYRYNQNNKQLFFRLHYYSIISFFLKLCYQLIGI